MNAAVLFSAFALTLIIFACRFDALIARSKRIEKDLQKLKEKLGIKEGE